ncbi:hypothetical protein B0T19DRAFT_116749 [Cercophora scortea]|uniref:Serine/threonine-protein kinase ppk6 n=1 Tax=Cercophora scortea TaxID=314031 RepID=A0AAE0IXH0_9PEZI|nr:hypothetical protein B0T19DRAFT_116749 [Cercophora scortea]
MSADLFAAFESGPPQGSSSSSNSASQQKRPQYGGIAATTAVDDPFSFLATSSVSAHQAHQRHHQQAAHWPPLQQQTESPASLWPTLQSNQPQTQQRNADVWGDFGGLAGIQTGPSLVQQTAVKPDEDEDGWGDFEVASPVISQPQPPFPESLTKAEPPRTRVVRAQTMDLIANKLVDVGITPSGLDAWQEPPSWEAPLAKVPAKKPDSQKPKSNPDPNVLFDVDDFELHTDADDGDDDDFGDFESEVVVPAPSFQPAVPSPAATQTKKQPPGLMLPSSRTTSGDGSLYPQAPKSPYGSFQTRKPDPVKQLRVKTPLGSEFPKEVKQRSPSPVTAWPTVGADDDWAEFEDLPADNKPHTSSTKVEINPPKPATGSSALAAAKDSSGPPPTNVPPPSVLLSIFPQLLDLANTSLLKPISTLPASGRQAVATNAATVLFLRGHLTLATVAARIIAGRKQRWHRDKFLMQSMSISAAGGKGGMKLAGVDKTQSAREDREAAEVLAVWQSQVGRLRSAVAAANQASSSAAASPLRVPELSINVSAHAAPMVATAPKPCVICGLKRDERIPRVDVDVEDSFGEWWVEYWGHRACRNFWLEHEVKLRQR